ncbi:MAG: metal ABC transporter substrate-binding protein [Candidatus Micrarchaeota archaeon]|nr:metal ABC transporter substrate-binding protein [Candidatus Micrarchaeota archaeon]
MKIIFNNGNPYKTVVTLLLLLILILILYSFYNFFNFNNHKDEVNNKIKPQDFHKNRITVIVTTPILYLLARTIAENSTIIDVQPLLTAQDIHEHTLTLKDYSLIENADLVLFEDEELEGYIKDIKKATNNHSKFIELSTFFPINDTIRKSEFNEIEDPHRWMSPKNVKLYLKALKDVFSNHVSLESNLYEINYNRAIKKIDALHNDLQSSNINCSNKLIITSHKFLTHYCQSYKCSAESLLDIHSHESEMTPLRYKKLLELIKSQKINKILVDRSDQSSIVDNFIKENSLIKAELETFHSWDSVINLCNYSHSNQPISWLDCYVNTMYLNAKTISEAMGC